MFKNFVVSIFLAVVILTTSLFVSTPSIVSAEEINEVEPTPFFTILYGSVNMEDGNPAPVGTLVQFFTSRNEIAGECIVQNTGILAFTHIYGNDGIGTSGFIYQEPISVKVNGENYNVWPRITWQNDWDIHQISISPIVSTAHVSVSGGPRFLTFTTNVKVLIHATSCNGVIAQEILPGTTILDTGASSVTCPGSTWEFFEVIPLEQGTAIETSPNHLIGWGQGESPYLWIWERKDFSQICLPLIIR